VDINQALMPLNQFFSVPRQVNLLKKMICIL